MYMSYKLLKLVKILMTSFQFLPFLVIFIGSIEKLFDVTFFPPYISKQVKKSELTSVQPKYMQTFTTFDEEFETK